MTKPKLSRETKGFGAMILMLAVLLLSSYLPKLLNPKVDAPPLIAVDGRAFELEATVEELYSLGLILKDLEGNEINPADWDLEKKTVLSEIFILALADSDQKTTIQVNLYNPTSKLVPLSQTKVYAFTCDFSDNSEAQVPITIWGVDYKGFTAKKAMESIAAIGDLSLDEFQYKNNKNKANFSNGPYKYNLTFSDGGTMLDTMSLRKYVQVDYDK